MRYFSIFSVFGMLVMGAVSIACAQPSPLQFDRDIRPILSAHCFSCHGPDEDSREADLRLDTESGMFGDLGGYRSVVPREPGQSELFLRITAADADERMPPAESDQQLSKDETELIKRWIEQGAKWQRHWSFVAPSRAPLPETKQADWVRTPVDRFVLAKLEQHELQPSPAADRHTLIRRVTLDLTGLPPAPGEVDEFLADTSADAYERVADRLLSSPHYGEQMARIWLDAARYADTHGLHLDNYREIWPYRDWVIQAFNSNMPYDQFVIEQLAGDLLPDPTLDQLVATGFNRCHVTTNEGGSIDEEVYVRNVIDRVNTTGTVVLGLTLGCAVCHDHKFDPIKQREFYELFAFFNGLDGPSMDGNVKDHAPVVRVPTEEQNAGLDALRKTMDDVRARRAKRLQATDVDFSNWLAGRFQQADSDAADEEFELADGLVVHCKLDEGAGSQVVNEADTSHPGQVKGSARWVEGRIGRGLRISNSGYVDLGDVGDFKNDQKFSYGAWVRIPKKATGAVLAKTETKEGVRGYDLSVDKGRVSALLSSRWPGYAIKVTTAEKEIKPDTWHHLFVTYDGSRHARGVRIYVDGRPRVVEINSDSLKSEGSLGTNKPLLVGRRETHYELKGGQIDDVRMYDRRLSETDVQAVYLGSQLEPVLRGPHDQMSVAQREQVRHFYLVLHDPLYHELSALLDQLQKHHDRATGEMATSLVFRERKQPRPAYLLVRGQYDQQGEQVQRSTPAFLPPMPQALPRNRLGLAKWLVSPESATSGLSSRVQVNRIWQQLFGIGLVKTSGDFGVQGERPSHPEILDWLAVEFQDSGWDIKALIKCIVMSATYRQSSKFPPTSSTVRDLQSIDPENRWLARGPRFRMDAEMLRDQALAVSGLLVRDTIGGPSVKPPQPDGLWFAVGYSGSNTVRFEKDNGPDKVYRRSLYTFWKRTAPPPQMSAFDAPSRESCTVRRERTNTPLQALLLMNDPQYIEAARHLAQRTMKEAAPTPRDGAAWAFEQACFRPPEKNQLDELVAAYRELHADYSADPQAAKDLIQIGEAPPDPALDPVELATWTMVASVILNLDEVVTRE